MSLTWKEHTQQVKSSFSFLCPLFFYLPPALSFSHILSLLMRIKENDVIIFTANYQRQTPCKQLGQAELCCSSNAAWVKTHTQVSSKQLSNTQQQTVNILQYILSTVCNIFIHITEKWQALRSRFCHIMLTLLSMFALPLSLVHNSLFWHCVIFSLFWTTIIGFMPW